MQTDTSLSSVPCPDASIRPLRARRSWALAAILVLAFVVRTLGPLREVALGQTDAYMHLQYLTDMVRSGRLPHPFYPSGYYRIVAIPMQVLGLDPYAVARFSGAFFGTGLVLALYVLANRAFDRRTALWTAFLAAGFPAFHWLQKTGIGAYPTQLGLLCLPVILLGWDAVMRRGPRSLPGLAAGVMLLASAVPMMLLDLLPFLALDFGFRCARREVTRSAWIAVIGVAVLFAVVLGVMLASVGFSVFVETGTVIAGLPPSPAGTGAMANALRVAWAYAGPERYAPAGWLFSVGAWGLGVTLGVTWYAVRRRSALVRMLAAWAMFTWVQTVFGIFQFEQYMRAGWPLLMALSVLGGWAVSTMGDWLHPRLRHAAHAVLIGSALWSLVTPPLPRPHLSLAESDLVETAHQLAAWSAGLPVAPAFAWIETLPPRGVTVWSRPYTGSPDHVGEPLHALLDACGRITLRTVAAGDIEGVLFDPGGEHLLLLDDAGRAESRLGLMHVVNPSLSSEFLRMRGQYLDVSRALREKASQASQAAGWRMDVHMQPQGLAIIRLRPACAGQPSSRRDF